MREIVGFVVFLTGLMVSIGLHEMGHFLPAKRFGVRVPQFMIGFGPTLWSRVRNGTEFGFKAIPMGGYVRLVGMFPPRNREELSGGRWDELTESAREESLSQIDPDDGTIGFYELTAPKKIIVMLGGPVMNLVLATLFFLMSWTVIGHQAPTLQVASLVPCVPTQANPDGIASNDGSCGGGAVSPSVLAGIQPGDTLIAVHDYRLANWYDIGALIETSAGREIPIVVKRNGKSIELWAPITTTQEFEPRAFLGVSPTMAIAHSSVRETGTDMWRMTTASIGALGHFPSAVLHTATQLFSDVPRDPNGPVSVIGIGKISGEIAAADMSLRDKVASNLDLLGSVNLFLFLFNLVPLLPLDGGHVLGAMYEGIRRTVSRVRGKGATGPADTARMLPFAYVMTVLMIGMSVIVMAADILKPMSLG